MDTNENILLIRLKSIGDILFTLPAVHVVRENFPGAKLYFLVSKENALLLRGFSKIDAVIPLDRAVYFSKNLQAMCRSTFELLRRLRAPGFSRVIDFQGYGETEFFTWWSGAPERWGCVYHSLRGWTYTRGVRRNEHIHPADGNLSLLQQCGLRIGEIRNEFVLPGDALDEAGRFFAAHNLDPAKPTLYLQPFTSTPHKNWPLEEYLLLAHFWRARGVQIIFSGGLGDSPRFEQARADGFVVAAGVSRLTDMGLVKLSTCVVGGDTGFLHLAVAMGRHVVMLMGSNAPGSAHPFRHADWTVTPPAGKSILEIPTAAVIEACARAFSEQAGNVSC